MIEELEDLLRECHAAVWTAISCEDGLDGAEGQALMHRIEARLPDLKHQPTEEERRSGLRDG